MMDYGASAAIADLAGCLPFILSLAVGSQSYKFNCGGMS